MAEDSVLDSASTYYITSSTYEYVVGGWDQDLDHDIGIVQMMIDYKIVYYSRNLFRRLTYWESNRLEYPMSSITRSKIEKSGGQVSDFLSFFNLSHKY